MFEPFDEATQDVFNAIVSSEIYGPKDSPEVWKKAENAASDLKAESGGPAYLAAWLKKARH